MNAKSIARGAIALAALTAGVALASEAPAAPETVVVAQAGAVTPASAMAASAADYPSIQAGVRAAVAQGPEALRRYVWRTRMIYNFRFADFAPKQ
jgi:hypothetical protein